MSQPLNESLPYLVERLDRARSVALFIDYDGTISPIVDRPEDAHLGDEVRSTLERLAAIPWATVAVISGRGIDDLRGRVGLRRIVYAGNHGLEIAGDTWSFVEPSSDSWRGELRSLCQTLEQRLSGVPGVAVENKGLSASVHYRRASSCHHTCVEDTVRAVLEIGAGHFCLRRGRMVCEVRPRVEWDKGAAARWVLRRLGMEAALPVYLGDDETDEDAFAALQAGITVRVGARRDTKAKYHLDDVRGVTETLRWLADRLERRTETTCA